MEPVDAAPVLATETMTAHEALRTEEGTIVGTAAYMSPEQAEGKSVDARSDIFSFGSMLYEMITGQRAFHGETKMSTLSAILSKEPARLGELADGVPAELEKIIARCLRKDPQLRIRDMHDVRIALEELKEESESGGTVSGIPAAVGPSRGNPWLVLSIAGAAVIVAFALWWWGPPRLHSPASSSTATIRRVTWDAGLTTDAALSPDGKLLAYASDRGEEGNLDIWVKQVAGGEPIRLTHNEADDNQPTFSPDGSKIAFHSEREGGGIYVMSTLGGEERLIASPGQNPFFSPDGKWIAYSVGYWPGYGALPSEIYMVASGGGPPKRFRPEFPVAGYPIWSPDGKLLIFSAVRDRKAPQETLDWWIAAPEGDEAIRTGALAVFEHQGLQEPPTPAAWVGTSILFSARLGDGTNLSRVEVSPGTWKITAPARRVTFGTSIEIGPSVATGPSGHPLVAFSSLTENLGVWRQPLDTNRGKAAGAMQRLTAGVSHEYFSSLSADGKKMIFHSQRSGSPDLWLKDLVSGREMQLTQGEPVGNAWISADGSTVAYGALVDGKQGIYAVEVGSGGERPAPAPAGWRCGCVKSAAISGFVLRTRERCFTRPADLQESASWTGPQDETWNCSAIPNSTC
jgi:eukaryotic-like serine/threonine-protein kinase